MTLDQLLSALEKKIVLHEGALGGAHSEARLWLVKLRYDIRHGNFDATFLGDGIITFLTEMLYSFEGEGLEGEFSLRYADVVRKTGGEVKLKASRPAIKHPGRYVRILTLDAFVRYFYHPRSGEHFGLRQDDLVAIMEEIYDKIENLEKDHFFGELRQSDFVTTEEEYRALRNGLPDGRWPDGGCNKLGLRYNPTEKRVAMIFDATQLAGTKVLPPTSFDGAAYEPFRPNHGVEFGETLHLENINAPGAQEAVVGQVEIDVSPERMGVMQGDSPQVDRPALIAWLNL